MSGLSQRTLDAIAAAVASAVAQALVPTSAPKGEAKAASPFVAEVIRGQHPCTAEPSCGRVLRTAKRAATHGADGHSPAGKRGR